MPSALGELIELRTPHSHAFIGTVAAVLAGLDIGGHELVEATPADRVPSHGNGIVLAPWPNRVRDARWVHEGVPQQLDVSDPSNGCAIHGLLRNTAYRVRERSDAEVLLGAVIYPQHGWPFLLDTWVRYSLAENGLTVTHGVRNLGTARAPWAVGAHPYFRVGDTPVHELTLEVRAPRRLEIDAQLLPVGVHEIPASDPFDLRSPRLLAELDLNVGYQDVATGPSGAAVLTAPDGRRTVVWQDAAFRWLQVFTPRDFRHLAADGSETPALAVALEPMTAAPDALNSGEGLIWLDAGESWEASWGVRDEEER